MKRFLLLIICTLSLSSSVFAQVQITTKKEKLSDIITKTTKVVLTGNDFLDLTLKEAVKNSWIVTPFEFCTMEEFSSLKSSGDYYFMVPVTAKGKKEDHPGVYILTFVKGGTGKTVNDMLEVAEFPLCAADSPSGREAVMAAGVVDVLQSQVRKVIATGRTGGVTTSSLSKIADKNVFISKEDLSPEVSDKTVKAAEAKEIIFCPAETADDAFTNGGNAVVSYTVAPADPAPGSVCYVMLFSSRTHELFYFAKHKIGKNLNSGFTTKDIITITKSK